MTNPSEFAEDTPEEVPPSSLHLALEGYEGPLDVLLDLARSKKLDLSQISVLDLANQYLEFIRSARVLELNLAADYLVMASWLVYLKSRLLLPVLERDPEPSGEELAHRLAVRLRALEAMQQAAGQLWAQPRLGEGRLARGAPESLAAVESIRHEASLYDLLEAYGTSRNRLLRSQVRYERESFYAFEDALERIESLLGVQREAWLTLDAFIPDQVHTPQGTRTARASLFAASLDLAKRGKLELHQSDLFGPISLRAKAP